MKSMLRATMLFLVGYGLWAQTQIQTGTQPPSDSTGVARVEGRVTNSLTGEPLRKGELTLRGGPNGAYTGTSDSTGHFAIEKIAPGAYDLIAQHQNYAVQNYGATRAGMPGTKLNLTAGQSMASVEIKLVPFGVITGKVVDQDGDPVTNVPLSVMRWGFGRGSRQLQNSGGGVTNDRGEYRIFNLPAGRYILVARPNRPGGYVQMADVSPGRRIVARAEQGTESNGTTFYPSSLDAASAASIPLSAGQEIAGIDIQLRKTRVYEVQGKISGFRPKLRFFVHLQPKGESGAASAGGYSGSVRPDDGTFRIAGVPPGQYTLMALADNRAGAWQDVSVGDSDVEGLTIVVAEPGTVKGKVQVETSGTTPPPALKNLHVALTPIDRAAMLPNTSTEDNGTFSLEQVSADRYRVSCSPLAGTYLKSIRWNGQESKDSTVEMTGGGTSTLDLVFAATSAQIDGDVKAADDQPAVGARVILVPASRHESDLRVTTTDQNGHFTAKNVAPGNYVAFAPDADFFGMPDAAFLKAIEKETTQVTVDENGHATASLKLIPEAVLEADQ